MMTIAQPTRMPRVVGSMRVELLKEPTARTYGKRKDRIKATNTARLFLSI
jgi:hypothetical protein